MISTQLRHEIPGVDEIVRSDDSDFTQTGLKLPSVIRATRLAVIRSNMLQGAIGSLTQARLERIRLGISEWIFNSN